MEKRNGKCAAIAVSKNVKLVCNSVTGEDSGSVELDVPFPDDYSELIEQVRFISHLQFKGN